MRLSARVPVLLFAALSALSVATAASDSPVDLTLTDAAGNKVHLKDYRGKIVVLNFWATWCRPCHEEMPMLVEAQSRWKIKGVVFLGASLDDKKTVGYVPAFVEKYHISFPIWTGASGDDLDRLGLGNAVPDTAFISANGSVVFRIQGMIRGVELEERLSWLTSDRTGPAPAPLVRHLEK